MGALAAYQFLNIKDINKLIRNIFLLEKNRLHKIEIQIEILEKNIDSQKNVIEKTIEKCKKIVYN